MNEQREPIRRRSFPESVDPRDLGERRVLRWSVAGAVVVHALVLALPLPVDSVEAEEPEPPRVITVLKPLAPPARPEPEPLPDPVESPRVTIPVPEIDDPEPLPRDEPLPEPDPTVSDSVAPLSPAVLDAPPPPPPEPADGPVHVVGNVEPPEALHAPRPRYPETARQVGMDGLVILEAVIGPKGRVQEVEVLRGAPLGMTKAAVEAVRGWRFRPATRDGRPVAVYYHLTVRFRHAR